VPNQQSAISYQQSAIREITEALCNECLSTFSLNERRPIAGMTDLRDAVQKPRNRVE